jgi:CBS-domain-containing membrane protein
MTAPAPTVDCRATLEQAFRLMQENSATTVGVTDNSGRLVGLVTSETLAEMMTLMALPSRVGNRGTISPTARWVRGLDGSAS